ncbi:MAG TPA: mandelate racemase/muconate lactonizing enzyme family protein [Chloroflexota bacterium]|nr:mandelate racemase/muconate lactonizing enzyme family protein [Chloroflexota bacterium]
MEAHVASDGLRNATYVTVTTESGMVGLGEAYTAGPDLAVAETVRYLGDWLVGQDASRRERLWAECYRGLRFPAGAVGWAAISGIDLALWDLAGKAADLPVYELLGGVYRERIWVYLDIVTGEPEFMAEQARAGHEQEGFTAFKVFPYATEDDVLPWRTICDLVVARVAAVRAAVGEEADIGVDFHSKLEEPARAAELARRLEPFRPMFIEEPIRPGSHAVMAETRRRFTIPLATGESLYGKHEFLDLIDAGAVDLLQPDLLLCGGLTELRKIAAVAEAHMISLIPHNPFGPLTTVMTAHFAAATPNFTLMELPQAGLPGSREADAQALRRSFVEVDTTVSDGHLALPEGPGWGARVNLDEIARHPYQPWRRPVPEKADGGFGFY